MSREIGEVGMKSQHERCNEEVKKFEKEFLYGKNENETRTEKLWDDCKQLKASEYNLKYLTTDLKNRMDKLETTLGYYVGSDNFEKPEPTL